MTDPGAAERIKKFYAEIAVPADSFARAVAYAMSQPDDVDINVIQRDARRTSRRHVEIDVHAVIGEFHAPRPVAAVAHALLRLQRQNRRLAPQAIAAAFPVKGSSLPRSRIGKSGLRGQFGPGVSGFGGKAAFLAVPRRRSIAFWSALSFFSSGGTKDCEPDAS